MAALSWFSYSWEEAKDACSAYNADIAWLASSIFYFKFLASLVWVSIAELWSSVLEIIAASRSAIFWAAEVASSKSISFSDWREAEDVFKVAICAKNSSFSWSSWSILPWSLVSSWDWDALCDSACSKIYALNFSSICTFVSRSKLALLMALAFSLSLRVASDLWVSCS